MNKDTKLYFQSLSRGERGTMIYIAQKLLNTIGYNIKADGIFSAKMEETVKIFQSTRKKLQVDGIIGYKTMKELDNISIC